jgi:hypothetical protein
MIEPDQWLFYEDYDKSILTSEDCKIPTNRIRKIAEESKKLLGLVTEKLQNSRR